MCFALSIILGLQAAGQLAAQSTTADILGTVTDSTGAILPGAKVTMTALATNEKREATANAAGEFVFNNLNPGHYRVEVITRGFRTYVVPNLLAAAGDRARVDAKLPAGALDETIVVQAMTPLLQTDSSTVATTLINIVTKLGGNQFHGTLYEYFRNDVLDATNDVVQPQTGVTLAKSELRQNQFGGSVGGRIPPGGSVADQPFTPASCRPATVACSIGQVGQLATESASSYHSLQAMFQRRFNRGLAIDLNYTWAHQLDNTTGISTQLGDGWGAAWALQKQLPLFEYGNSDLDLRHRIAANIIYQLPFGNGLSGGLRGVGSALAKGWQLNTLAAWQTGNPMTVVNSSVISGTTPGVSNGHDRPNQTGSARASHPSKNEWFNTSAFVQQPANTLCDERRNQLFAPHYAEVDLSLLRDFPVFHDKASVQFRAECFNMANHPALGNPDLTVQDGPGIFGVITSTSSFYKPREFQFALKLLF